MDSTYPFTVGETTFYFSSMFYRQKFMNDYHEEMKRFNESTEKRYRNKFIIDMSILSLIRLYVLVEKRGFYIKLKGEIITCPEELIFVLQVEKKQKYSV